MLRRILLTSAGAMALTGAALAADLRPPPLPVYVPPPSWTGFYAGLNAGGTWSGVKSQDTVSSVVTDNGVIPGLASTSAALATASVPLHPTAAFIGGGQLGYNYQFYNSFIAGFEADIQGTSSDFRAQGVFSQATVAPGVGLASDIASSQSTDWLGTVRGRLGFLFTPTLLIYGTGGFAYGQTNAITYITQFVTGSSTLPNAYSSAYPCFNSATPPATVQCARYSNTGTGWTAGGGLEWLFMPNWSFKIENLYYNLGSVSYNAGVLANNTTTGALATWVNPISKASFNGNIVRVGVNYHFFSWPPVVAPVVAKY
jgi:outer membrane immunogenic protein